MELQGLHETDSTTGPQGERERCAFGGLRSKYVPDNAVMSLRHGVFFLDRDGCWSPARAHIPRYEGSIPSPGTRVACRSYRQSPSGEHSRRRNSALLSVSSSLTPSAGSGRRDSVMAAREAYSNQARRAVRDVADHRPYVAESRDGRGSVKPLAAVLFNPTRGNNFQRPLT